ncbi:PREDICTED: VQ motif-containing protein 11 [Tarenaya hassleriana]|uniref:VQ motif-containing protein 11 n=1 Tax=Tarenaya hassleriana TaxID=28532 RepID=UPI00053C62EA|nr:PREDICTED: VQ motif-containing protein 11 [Tarenaya hassleriana]
MSHRNSPPPAPSSYVTDPNTTFVQADPSNFRTIVQKLTGAPHDAVSPSSTQQKLPLTPKKPAFKLHERRQSAKKLELKLNNAADNANDPLSHFRRGFLVSPVSHLDPYWTRVSPHSARGDHHALDEEEQKAIARKGFYLHPSPRSGADAPELLPLFPLQSPNSANHTDHHHYRES